MMALTDRASIEEVLNNYDLDPDLRALIGLRAWQLDVTRDRPMGDTLILLAVEGGDPPDVINEAIGFALTGPEAEQPCYDWIQDHGLWFEVAYGRREGRIIRLFVENTPATELGVHTMCLAHFWPEEIQE